MLAYGTATHSNRSTIRFTSSYGALKSVSTDLRAFNPKSRWIDGYKLATSAHSITLVWGKLVKEFNSR